MSNHNFTDEALRAAMQLRAECEPLMPRTVVTPVVVARSAATPALAAAALITALYAVPDAYAGAGYKVELACAPTIEEMHSGEWKASGTMLVKHEPVIDECLARANMASRAQHR